MGCVSRSARLPGRCSRSAGASRTHPRPSGERAAGTRPRADRPRGHRTTSALRRRPIRVVMTSGFLIRRPSAITLAKRARVRCLGGQQGAPLPREEWAAVPTGASADAPLSSDGQRSDSSAGRRFSARDRSPLEVVLGPRQSSARSLLPAPGLCRSRTRPRSRLQSLSPHETRRTDLCSPR